ncbi:MAG: fluoride efflux transporter CrcB [Emergencia sp.]
MFFNCIAVGAGGFAGSVFRYLISLIPAFHRCPLPLHTLLVNIAGAVLIGVIARYAQVHETVSPQMILFLKTGICGGFTTFSTFALESADLLHSGSHLTAACYMILSVAACVAGIYLGQGLVR